MKTIYQILTKNQLAIGLVFLNITLLIIYTPNHYYFEMMQSMAFQIFIIISIFSLFYLLSKKWVGFLSCALATFLILNQLPILSRLKPSNGNLKVAHYNVLKHNTKYLKTINSALQTDADIISFNEVSPMWAAQLKLHLQNKYPYNVTQLAPNNSFGIAVYSKHKIENAEIHYWGSETIPTITGETIVNNKRLTFVAAHTIPPVRKDLYSKRNNHLASIKNYLSNVKGPKMLIGDLNAVSWSEPLKTIQYECNMLDSRKSWQPTYPSWNKLLAIPIDHIFYSNELTCTQFKTLKDTNSDHFGIYSEFNIENYYSQKN